MVHIICPKAARPTIVPRFQAYPKFENPTKIFEFQIEVRFLKKNWEFRDHQKVCSREKCTHVLNLILLVTNLSNDAYLIGCNSENWSFSLELLYATNMLNYATLHSIMNSCSFVRSSKLCSKYSRVCSSIERTQDEYFCFDRVAVHTYFGILLIFDCISFQK